MNPATRMPWPTSVLEFGLDLAAKATVLLVVALLLQELLGRRRAVLGSAAAHAALIGLMLLPFSSLALPSLAIPCLPARPEVGTSDPEHAAILAFAASGIGQCAGDTTPLDRPLDNLPADSKRQVALVPPTDAAPSALRRAARSALLTPATPIGLQASARPLIRNSDWATIAVAIYALGASLLLAKVAASVSAVARLRRSCREVHDAEWTEALERWRRRLGIGRAVVLARSTQVSVPVALGWLRPTIVLPDPLSSPRSAGAIDAVLLHELSHLARGDYAWNLLLRVVQAVYWPHVLVWVLGRAIAEIRERVCDELCICELGGPGAYRDALLAVASGIVRRPSPALGLAMARSSKLGKRLAQIERSAGDHRYLAGWPATLFLGTMAITAAGVLGAAQLVRAEPRAEKLDDRPRADATAPSVKNAGRILHLQVVAAGTNEPVPDAEVRLRTTVKYNEWRKTNAQGRLEVVHSTGPSDRILGLEVWGKGRAMQRRFWDNDSNQPIPDTATIALQPGETLGGITQDETGRPIAGATVYLWSYNYKKKDAHEALYHLRAISGPDGKWQTSGAPETTGELFGFKIEHPNFLSIRDYGQKDIIPKIADLRAGTAVTVMKKGVPIEGRVVDADGNPVAGARVLSTDHTLTMAMQTDPFAVTTDANGQFRTGQVKPGPWFLIATAKGHAPGDQKVTIEKAVPQVEIKLGRSRVFKGRVVDRDRTPVSGALVVVDSWRQQRCLGEFLWTDADGRFRWDDAPSDQLLVNVSAPGYRAKTHERVVPSGNDATFTLARSIAVRGRLVDAKTKKRVDNALVEYSAVDAATGKPLKWTTLPDIGVGTGVHQGNLDANFPVTESAYKIRVRSAGYLEFVSRTFRPEEKVVLDYDIALVPGTTAPSGAVATVVGPNGKPLAGATLVEKQAGGQLSIENGLPNLLQARKVREDRTSPDGSFRIDDVPPGEYRLAIRVNGESAFHDTLTLRRDKGPFLRAVKTFTMPEAPRARRDPLDLGVVQLQPRVVLQPGQPAPAFEAATVDGKKLNVPGDFWGKSLLLDFGTTWDVQSRHQIPPLNLVYEKFGKDPDPRLAVVSLLSASDTAATRKFIEEKGEPWPQAIVGPLSNPIASLYGIDDENVSTMTLIGPDGRIVATGLWSEKIAEAVAKALGPVDH